MLNTSIEMQVMQTKHELISFLEKQPTFPGQQRVSDISQGCPTDPNLCQQEAGAFSVEIKSSGQLQPEKAVAWSRDMGLNLDVASLQYPELFNICSCQLTDWKKCISNASAHCLSTSLFCCDSHARHSTGPLFRKVSNADRALCHHGSGLLLFVAIK